MNKLKMKKLKLTIIGILLTIIFSISVYAATVVTSGSEQYVVNQVIIGCDNNVAQELRADLLLDSDDCIVPGTNSARIKLIQTGITYQLLLVGDDVGLAAAVEILRQSEFHSEFLGEEVIVTRNVDTGEITLLQVTPGSATQTVQSLISLGNGNYLYSVDLQQGWNFISFPIVLSEDNPNIIFDSMRQKLTRIYSYDPSRTNVKWIKWNPEIGAPSEITQIVPQRGYIIYMSEPATLAVQGRAGVGSPEVPPSLSVDSGWNLLTVHGFLPRSMSSALNSISGKYDSVWTIVNNQLARLEISNNPDLQPGQTYWVHLTNSGTLVP